MSIIDWLDANAKSVMCQSIAFKRVNIFIMTPALINSLDAFHASTFFVSSIVFVFVFYCLVYCSPPAFGAFKWFVCFLRCLCAFDQPFLAPFEVHRRSRGALVAHECFYDVGAARNYAALHDRALRWRLQLYAGI